MSRTVRMNVKNRKVTFSGVKYATWFKPVPPLKIISQIEGGVFRVLAFNQDRYVMFFGEMPVTETEHDDLPATTVVNQLTEADAVAKRTKIIEGKTYVISAYGGRAVSEHEPWPDEAN
jgi:hypothetical protein